MNLDEAAFDLLDKNELSIVGIELTGTNLNDVAAAVADVLDLEPREVLVTDYLDRVVTVDILRRAVYPHQLLTSSASLLERVAAVPGVRLDPDASVRSRGMLGWIAADSEGLEQVLAQAQRQAEEILQRIAKRVLIFSTGAELVDGQVEDTNAATIATRLGEDGFACDRGGALRDDVDLIAGAIRSAIANGYGMIVTTGGVGAEAKDCTVEAVLKVDPSAATPYICRFEIDHGRHVKDGVRVAVGRHDGSLIVALPGPNDEVRSAIEVLRRELRDGTGHEEMAIAIARDLRGVLRDRMGGNS